MGNESQRRADLEEGIEKAREAERDLHKHPFSRPVTDAFGMYGFDQIGLGKDGQRAYEDLRGGKSTSEIRQEFEDSLGEENKSSRKGVVSSGGGDSGGFRGRRSSDREWDKTYEHDRHYHGSDYDTSISIPNWVKWTVGLGVAGILLIGLQSYTGSPKEKLGVEVARKYNLNERGLVEKSSGFLWTRVPESSEHYRKEIALYRLKNNKKEITPELEESLIGLRKLMESKKKEIRFNDYTQFENNIWVAGESSSDGACFGYMWHSPDCGNTWFWQLRIGPWLQKYNWGTPDVVPFGVHFFDSKEGWSFTQNIIFHTTDGGRKWNQSYKHNIGTLKQLYIIDKQNLVAMRKIPAVIKTNKRIIHSYWGGVKTQMEYTLDGGRTWKSHPEWKPEILGLEAKLIEDSSIKLESPYP